jgi:hypothetical protein
MTQWLRRLGVVLGTSTLALALSAGTAGATGSTGPTTESGPPRCCV